jgi:hypothetical protein
LSIKKGDRVRVRFDVIDEIGIVYQIRRGVPYPYYVGPEYAEDDTPLTPYSAEMLTVIPRGEGGVRPTDSRGSD